MLWIALVLFIVGDAVAQAPSLGNCPAVKIFPNFDASRCVGKWSLYGRYSEVSYVEDKCVTFNYTLNKDISFRIKISQISSINGATSNVDGISTPLSNAGALYTVAYPSLGVVQTRCILGTDYNNWGVLYSCTNFGDYSIRQTWILTREPQPKDSVLKEAYALLDSNKINRDYFRKTKQENCPKFFD